MSGGGHTSQIYAIRQAIARALVAYYSKYIDAASAIELKKKLVAYDRTLLIADPRRMEPKKFGGAGARARRQKRCVVAVYNYLTLIAPFQLPVKSHIYILCFPTTAVLRVCYAFMHLSPISSADDLQIPDSPSEH